MKSRRILPTAVTRHILPALVGSILFFSFAGAETITMPGAVIPQGQTADVPIFVTDPGSGIVGVDIVLRYDGSILKATGINVVGTDLENWSILHNVVEGVDGSTDEIRISGAAQNDPAHAEYGLPLDVTGTEPLLYVTFNASAASSPTSSAFQFMLADLNETLVSTNSDGSVLLSGNTGTVGLSLNSVKPTQTVIITVNDEDLNQNDEGIESVNVEVTSTKGAETVLLTETGGSTGEFTGQVTTVYGLTNSAGLPLEVEPGDQISVEYTDPFDGSGGSSVVTAQVSVVAGTDGTVSTAPARVSAAGTVTVTVNDLDMSGEGPLAATVTSLPTDDSFVVTLTETSPAGTFEGTVTLGTGLTVAAGDLILVDYDDEVGSDGAPLNDVLSVTPTDGSFALPVSIKVTDDLNIVLTDGDLASGGGTRVGDKITVTVRSKDGNEVKDTESVELTEGSLGTFTGTITTAYGATGSSNFILEVTPGYDIEIEYSDPLGASGSAATITADLIDVSGGIDGQVSTEPAQIDPAGSVTVTLSDPDLAGAGTAQVEVVVKRDGQVVPPPQFIDLIEDPLNPGTFTADVTVSGLGGQVGDQILVSYDDEVGSNGAPENGILSITPTSGSFGVLPAQLVVEDDLTITLSDPDLTAGTRVTGGTASLDVTVKNSTSGEQETLTLNEDPQNLGTFSNAISTQYASTPNSGNDVLGVKPDDQIVVEYQDGLLSGGDTNPQTSSSVTVIGGSDGQVSSAPDQILPGDDVTVTVQDADLGNSGTIQVTVRSKRGELELESLSVTLYAVTGSDNTFTGTVSTGTLDNEGEVVSGNEVLEVKRDDLIEAEYLDAVTTLGAAATRISSPAIQVQGAHTGVLIASVAVQTGDGLRIELSDPDLNTDPASPQSVDVTVSNNSNNDTETVSLVETENNSGVFRAVPPLTTNGAAVSSDNVLQMGSHDAIVVTYLDLLDDDSMLKVISAAVTGVLWGDTSVNEKVGALDASLILQRSVEVTDFTAYQTLVGNVDGSSHETFGDITAADATLVLQYVIGKINVFPAQSSNPPHPYKRVVDERQIALGTPERSGSLLSLPVQMDETSDVLSGQMRLKFDPNQYRIAGVTPAEPTADYLVSSNVVEDELLIAFAGAEARGAGAGSVLEIQLEVIGASHQGAPLSIEQVVLNGGGIQATPVEHIASLTRPQTFGLLPNWPNPFNPETTLSYILPEESPVSLEVYDMLGQKVRTLVNDTQAAGSHEARWNGLDASGRPVASGTYLYRLEAGRFAQTRKMTLLR